MMVLVSCLFDWLTALAFFYQVIQLFHTVWHSIYCAVQIVILLSQGRRKLYKECDSFYLVVVLCQAHHTLELVDIVSHSLNAMVCRTGNLGVFLACEPLFYDKCTVSY